MLTILFILIGIILVGASTLILLRTTNIPRLPGKLKAPSETSDEERDEG